MSWEAKAACRNYDPEMWFPLKSDEDAGIAAAAKRICRQECWVQAECLERALAMDAEGIWAGMTKTDRKRIKRRRNRAA